MIAKHENAATSKLIRKYDGIQNIKTQYKNKKKCIVTDKYNHLLVLHGNKVVL